MNWEAAGAIGEIVGAIGVIGSIAYLAFQIGQTNRISRSSVVRELQQQYLDFYSVILENDDFARLIRRLADPDYKPEDEGDIQKLDTFGTLVASIWFGVEVSYSQGQLDRDLYDIYREDVLARLDQWPAMKPFFRMAVERYPRLKDREIFRPLFE